MGKDSKKKLKDAASPKKADSDDEMTSFNPVNLLPIAHPLAGKKLCKKLLKTVKKASKEKHVKRGVKEVVKALRKNEQGLVVLAGDISPMDVITHLPVLCEESNVPYCYVPSKQALGQAGSTRRPTSVVMLPLNKKKGADYEEAFDACFKEIQGLPILPSVTA